MAEAIFSHLVAEAGLSDQITIDSAATSPWEIGKTIHEDANERLQALGIPTPKHGLSFRIGYFFKNIRLILK